MKTITRRLTGILFGLAVIAACCMYMSDAHAASPMKVHMINVGKADSVLLECNGHYALVDGGYASHVGNYRDGKKEVDTLPLCRLDKYGTMEDALNGKVADLSRFYSLNLFSFFEHFDNDMKTLVGGNTTLTKDIMAAVPGCMTAFDEAVQEYEEKKAAYDDAMEQYRQEPGEEQEQEGDPDPDMPVMEDTSLTKEEWECYQNHKELIDGIRDRLGKGVLDPTATIQAFMELQKEDVIKAESNQSILFRYYSALGYQYIYEQADAYLKTPAYTNGGFNYCLAYLKDQGVTVIDHLILSHAHRDHVGGLIAVLASDDIEVNNIYYNGTSYGTSNFRLFEHEMLDRAKEGTQIIKADDNTNNTFNMAGAVFTQLGDTNKIPAYTKEPVASESSYFNHIVNNQSLVYRVDYDGTSMLFSGDAEGVADGKGDNRQADILKKYKAKLNVDLYKVAHHAHNNASNASFNAAMSPCFTLVSCGTTKEPYGKARTALEQADMWVTKGKGKGVVAAISRGAFKVVNGSGKDITAKPDYRHKLCYVVKTNFGTPSVSKASFAKKGRTVAAVRKITTPIEYYNRPSAKAITIKITPGWYYETVHNQICKKGSYFTTAAWKEGRTATMQPGFCGNAFFRCTNKFGLDSFKRKTDGFETRAAVNKIRKGRACLYRYNAATVDWYPVKGAKSYKVWVKIKGKWKSQGTTKNIYKSISGLPNGKKVKVRIKATGKKGYAYINVRTLKQAKKPKVKRKGGKVQVSWKKVTGSSGYQVAYGYKLITVGSKSRKITLAVRKGRELYYRVRAYKKTNGIIVYAPWSKVRKY